MTDFQTTVFNALAPFAAFDKETVNFIDGRMWVWLHTCEPGYRKARAALRQFNPVPCCSKRDFKVTSPEGCFEVWVHLNSAPIRRG